MKNILVLALLLGSTVAQAETCKISFTSAKLGTFLTKRDSGVEYGKGVGITSEYGYTLNETRVSPDTYIEHVDLVRIDGEKITELNCPNQFIRNKVDAVVATETSCAIDSDTTLTVRCSIYGLPLEE